MNKTYKDFIARWSPYSEYLFDKYPNVKFSNRFYDVIKDHKADVSQFKLFHLAKLESFILFYNIYKPLGIRIIDGEDEYLKAKEIYDSLINGDMYIDDVFIDRENVLNRIVKLMPLDEDKALENLKNDN